MKRRLGAANGGVPGDAEAAAGQGHGATRLFMHVPKAAGTSVLTALARRVPPGRLLELYENQTGKHEAEIRDQIGSAWILFGHFSVGIHSRLGIAPCYGTVLRNPVPRIVSFYHHMANREASAFRARIAGGMSLTDFVESGISHETDNHMTRILAGIEPEQAVGPAELALAKVNLAALDYVGIFENLDIDALETFFGVGRLTLPRLNVGRYAEDLLTANEVAAITRHNQLDGDLYAFAVVQERARRGEPLRRLRARDAELQRQWGENAQATTRLVSMIGRQETQLRLLRQRTESQAKLVVALSAAVQERAQAIESLQHEVAASAAARPSRSLLHRGLRKLLTRAAALAPVSEAGNARRQERLERIRQSGLFDAAYYLEKNPDVALAGLDPLEHYESWGGCEGRDPHPLFETSFYRGQRPPLANEINPLLHFLDKGAAAGRDPNPEFSIRFYLAANPDVLESGMNPLFHYAAHGVHEGRLPSPRVAADNSVRLLEAQRGAGESAALLGESSWTSGAAESLAAAKELWRSESALRLKRFLQGESRLDLSSPASPRLSVILVLYNQAALTLGCLEALAATGPADREVIIVDNQSTDETATLLARLDGAPIIRNHDNRGYAGGVNQGAAVARGEFLLLLNNDCVPFPGALEAGQRTIEMAGDIGAVGGRILLADGRLQEAGCIVWRDGSCAGYGRGDNPERGEYCFRRDVDFCSGVFLMVRQSVFAAMGGMDERFHPGYGEDVDLCLRLKQMGYRTVYEPDVLVRHFEYGSSVDAAAAVALQRKAAPQLIAKHADLLPGQPVYDGPVMLRARTAGDAKHSRVLIIDDFVPHWSLGSGAPRAAALLWAVCAAGRTVTLFATSTDNLDWQMVRAVVPPEVEVLTLSGESLSSFLAARRGYYQTIIVSRPHNMQAVQAAAGPSGAALAGAHVIYDAEALFVQRDILRARLAGNPLPPAEAERLIAAEVALGSAADDVLVVSREEAACFAQRGAKRVHLLGDAMVPAPTPRPFAERQGLLFVGPLPDEDTPNVDGLAWFIERVLPILTDRLGAMEISIVGACTSRRVLGLAGPGIKLHGIQADLEPFYDRCRLFVAPNRFAAGVPHKILEAAAKGLPVVATGLLAAQLGWQSGREIMAADGAEGFAEACVQAYGDHALWENLRAGAMERLRKEYPADQFNATVRDLLNRKLVAS